MCERKCFTCRYYSLLNASQVTRRVCNRFPPTVVVTQYEQDDAKLLGGGGQKVISRQAFVAPDQSCGEWKSIKPTFLERLCGYA